MAVKFPERLQKTIFLEELGLPLKQSNRLLGSRENK